MTAVTVSCSIEVRHVPACPACGNPETTIAFTADETARQQFRDLGARRFGGAMDGWERQLSLSVCYCSRCRHHWHADQPDQDSLFRMYAAKLWNPQKETAQDNAGRDAARRQARLLRRRAGGGEGFRLLDYGSGAGYWIDAFVETGFDAQAFETVPERIAEDEQFGSTVMTWPRWPGWCSTRSTWSRCWSTCPIWSTPCAACGRTAAATR